MNKLISMHISTVMHISKSLRPFYILQMNQKLLFHRVSFQILGAPTEKGLSQMSVVQPAASVIHSAANRNR